jgi:hypothetical protein
MYRKIIVPESANISISLPENFIGRHVEVIAFTIEDKQITETQSEDGKYAWKNARKFFNDHRIDLSNFKFNRDEANER